MPKDLYESLRWRQDVDREFEGASDRAAAVVGAALLDAHLRDLFESVFSHDADLSALLEQTNASLQSLSAKSEMALALALISRREHRNLVIIRRIRNRFAHRIGQVSFSAPEISDRCAELHVPVAMRMPDRIPVAFLSGKTTDPSTVRPLPFTEPRQRFEATVTYTSKCLEARQIETHRTKQEPKIEFERPSQIIERCVARAKELLDVIAKDEARLELLKCTYDELAKKTDASPDAKERILASQGEIRKLESVLRDLRNSPGKRMLDLLSPPLESYLPAIRRWEAWIEQEKPV